MAMRRLFPQIRHASSEVVRTSLSVPGGKLPKVLESTVNLTAIEHETGHRYAIRGLIGQTLLKTMVRSGLVEGGSHRLEDISSCGAECEITVAGEWLEKLPEQTEDEVLVLRRNSDRRHTVDVHSRLGCQIVLDRSLDGMAFAVPEAKPWRTL